MVTFTGTHDPPAVALLAALGQGKGRGARGGRLFAGRPRVLDTLGTESPA